ncbi:MAG TPA: chitobiase/beta-hexosaminidase C-terminal domain-containing protein, partial [Candidatus Saccharimonadales bacterium]|nr:chitobiase/beta-hexosaminidase C-terminal domain-containing protein [Candidatus Saccharimonadales bacterium]
AHWLPEMNWVAGYWASNHVRVIKRYRSVGLWPVLAPPTAALSKALGAPGLEVFLSHTNKQGAIHYTTDGSDPRSADGKPAGSSRTYSGPVIVPASLRLRARISDGVNWSPPIDPARLPLP